MKKIILIVLLVIMMAMPVMAADSLEHFWYSPKAADRVDGIHRMESGGFIIFEPASHTNWCLGDGGEIRYTGASASKDKGEYIYINWTDKEYLGAGRISHIIRRDGQRIDQ